MSEEKIKIAIGKIERHIAEYHQRISEKQELWRQAENEGDWINAESMSRVINIDTSFVQGLERALAYLMEDENDKIQFLSGADYFDADIWLIINKDNALNAIARGDGIPKLGRCVLTDGKTKYCIFHSIGKNHESMRSALRDYLEMRGE